MLSIRLSEFLSLLLNFQHIASPKAGSMAWDMQDFEI